MDQIFAAIDTATGSARSDRRATILIVEDSPVQAELLRRALEGEGYKVVVAGDGAEGLAVAKADRPDAVVSDINMPVMDGYGLCHAIRGDAVLKDTPVILLTMLSEPLDVIRGLNAGADSYVTKPYNIPALVSRLESLLAYPQIPPPQMERRKLEIRLAGETHVVDAHGPRMLNLLVSTYENAMLQNRERAATQHALEELNHHLEQRVLEQTAVLRDSERRFRTLIEDGSDLVVIIDTCGAITYVSPSIKRLGGYEIEEVLGPDFLEFTHPEDRDNAAAGIAEVLGSPAKRHVTELRFRHKNNTWITLESIERNALADPAINGIVMNLRDITERKLAQEALARKERYYRKLIEGGSDVFFLADPAGTLLYRSESGKQLTGWETIDVLGKPITNYVLPECLPLVRKAIAETLENPAQLTRVELCLLRKDGTQVEVEALGRNLLNDPDVGGIVVTARDITEHKRAEVTIRKVNRALKALSDCNMALVHASDEKQLLSEMCRIIVEVGGYRLAWVGFAEHNRKKIVRPVANAGCDQGYVERAGVTWDETAAGQGPAGTAIRTRKPQIIQDARTDPKYEMWRENAVTFGYGSVLGLPLLSAGKVLGALCIYSSTANGFEEEEIRLLTELADDLAFGIATLRTRALEAKGAERLLRSMEEIILATVAIVEMRDPYTAGHQRRVSLLSAAMAREMGLTESDVHGINLAAAVHDLGKIQVPAEILAKPGKLTDIEFSLIKVHSQAGYDILKEIDFPWPVAQMVYQHHERIDGSGYPLGLKEPEILIGAKIMAVADTVEAMFSHRPYRPGFGIDKALAEIVKNRGRLYDAQAVDSCVRLFKDDRFRFPE